MLISSSSPFLHRVSKEHTNSPYHFPPINVSLFKNPFPTFDPILPVFSKTPSLLDVWFEAFSKHPPLHSLCISGQNRSRFPFFFPSTAHSCSLDSFFVRYHYQSRTSVFSPFHHSSVNVSLKTEEELGISAMIGSVFHYFLFSPQMLYIIRRSAAFFKCLLENEFWCQHPPHFSPPPPPMLVQLFSPMVVHP